MKNVKIINNTIFLSIIFIAISCNKTPSLKSTVTPTENPPIIINVEFDDFGEKQVGYEPKTQQVNANLWRRKNIDSPLYVYIKLNNVDKLPFLIKTSLVATKIPFLIQL